MKYIRPEYVNKQTSVLVCGTATAPYNLGGDCNELLDGVLSLGVNAFDTARVYGGAERALGRWISLRGVREKIVLITKCCHPNALGLRRVNVRAMRRDIEKSLGELCTNYVDVLLLHRDDERVPADCLVEELNALREEGKVRAFGGSNWTYRRILAANEYAYKKGIQPFTFSSPDFSLAVRKEDIWGGGVSISGPDMAETRRAYAHSGMVVLAYSSLARGLFSGKFTSGDEQGARAVLDRFAIKGYLSAENLARLARCERLAKSKNVSVAQIALAYVLCALPLSLAAVSCTKLDRMRQNILAADITLSGDEIEYLESGKGL